MSNLATIGFKADVTGLKNAERGLDSLAKKGEQSERRINKSVDKTNQSFNSLRATIGLAGTALAALGSAQLTQQVIKNADAWKNVSNQLKLIAKDEKDLINIRKEVLSTADLAIIGLVQFKIIHHLINRLHITKHHQIYYG